MKSLIYLILLFISSHLFSQDNYILKNKNLIAYYELINKAELKIINNNLDSANILYKKAFKKNKFPQAKDIYNSLIVSLKIKDKKNAIKRLNSLRCFNYKFEDGFIEKNFNDYKYDREICKNKIDYHYKKSLDSLFEIDQYYRNLSGGNYKNFQKEITKNDSIASINLQKLIEKKGFPNEYNIGLESSNKLMYHKFYYIIWHQLATNLYSPQRVNFSNKIVKALNDDKIRPDIAAQLIELNNGNTEYSSLHFRIIQFFYTITNSLNEKEEKKDCCYISKYLLKENRDKDFNEKIEKINNNRKKIGLCSLEEEIKKNIYNLDKKEFIFTQSVTHGFNFDDENIIKNHKETLIKIK